MRLWSAILSGISTKRQRESTDEAHSSTTYRNAEYIIPRFAHSLTVPALADDRDKLIGNWKLISLYTEDAQSKQRVNPYGEQPKGHAMITADRLCALIAADGRKPPQTSDEQAAAFRSLIAYTDWKVPCRE
jgi:hypothetical protein